MPHNLGVLGSPWSCPIIWGGPLLVFGVGAGTPWLFPQGLGTPGHFTSNYGGWDPLGNPQAHPMAFGGAIWGCQDPQTPWGQHPLSLSPQLTLADGTVTADHVISALPAAGGCWGSPNTPKST